MKLNSLVCILLILLSTSSSPAYSFSVKALTLTQLTQLSERIFKGKVLEVSTDVDQYESGLPVRYFSFRVDDCIKGKCGTQITIKQVAGGRNGLPGYSAGQTYLLFLPEDSEKTGLVAPVGIWQGIYPLRQQNGRWLLKKGAANASILRGEIDYESFKQAILDIIKGEKQ